MGLKSEPAVRLAVLTGERAAPALALWSSVLPRRCRQPNGSERKGCIEICVVVGGGGGGGSICGWPAPGKFRASNCRGSSGGGGGGAEANALGAHRIRRRQRREIYYCARLYSGELRRRRQPKRTDRRRRRNNIILCNAENIHENYVDEARVGTTAPTAAAPPQRQRRRRPAQEPPAPAAAPFRLAARELIIVPRAARTKLFHSNAPDTLAAAEGKLIERPPLPPPPTGRPVVSFSRRLRYRFNSSRRRLARSGSCGRRLFSRIRAASVATLRRRCQISTRSRAAPAPAAACTVSASGA